MHGKYKTIITVFCGRQRYVSILMKYVTEMLRRTTVDECHLWDYTRNFRDYKYLATFTTKESDSRIKVVQVKNKVNFGEYYQFYAAMPGDSNTIVFKVDDDIVYIDVDAMPAFLDHRIANPEHLLCFPAIINNGLCAYYMQQDTYVGAQIPATPHNFELKIDGFETLVGDGVKAAWLHNWFLEGKEAGTQKEQEKENDAGVGMNVPLLQRISINMFAIMSKDLHLLAHPGVTYDDEKYLTMIMPSIVNRCNSVFPGMTVSHFGFGPQRGTGLDGDVETGLLARYDSVAKLKSVTTTV